MSRRTVALALAFVLLWSGLGSIESPAVFVPASPEERHSVAHAGQSTALHEGSVEDHHLDDLPSQAHNDSPTDTSVLPSAPWRPSVADHRAVGRPVVAAGTGPPVLTGPLRPPCDGLVA